MILSNFKKLNRKLSPPRGVRGLSCSLRDNRIFQILISLRVSHCSRGRLVSLKIREKITNLIN